MNTYKLIETKGVLPKLLFILILFSFESPNLYGQYTKWFRDTTLYSIEFKKIRFRNDGKFTQGYLKHETVIDGYPCHKNVTFDKNGKVKIFILSKEFTVAGNKFNKETQIIIRSNKDYLIHCLYNPVVQGYHIKRENYKRLFFMGSTNFQLYSNGQLKYFIPVDNIEIQGVWCKPSAVRGGVRLYENGHLKECTSSKEQIINGKLVGKNLKLKFAEDGSLIYAGKEKIFD